MLSKYVYVYAHALTHTHQSSILIVCQKILFAQGSCFKMCPGAQPQIHICPGVQPKKRPGAQPKMRNAWRAATLCPTARHSRFVYIFYFVDCSRNTQVTATELRSKVPKVSYYRVALSKRDYLVPAFVFMSLNAFLSVNR
jgi:hypothetical protein